MQSRDAVRRPHRRERDRDGGFKPPDSWDDEGFGEGEIVAALGFGKRVI